MAKTFIKVTNQDIFNEIKELQIKVDHLTQVIKIHEESDKGKFGRLNWMLGILLAWLGAMTGYFILRMVK